jgi:hypothetical protein
MPGIAFPPVGPGGLGSPPSAVLCFAKTASLPISGRFALARFPIPCLLPSFVVSLTGSCSGGSPRPRRGLWSPGPPVREYGPGDRWLSHVPEFPLCMHAPLSDPGGVLDPRHTAARTAAFRCVHTVGFPLDDLLRDILLSTTLHLSGLNHAACILAHSSFVLPLLGWHVEFATDLLARRSSGGT